MPYRLLLCLLAVLPLAAADQVVATAPGEALPDPADLAPWPEAGYPRFAPDSVVNATWLLDAPAGKHGHVSPEADGQLVFADGTPVRFWGTTLCYGATFPDQPDSEIELLADAIAAYGYNAVRFHHNDHPWDGIGFAADDGIGLDLKQMDRLDRLAAALIERGIYLYVGLVDSRHLTAASGFPYQEQMGEGHGWKGVFPHPAIAEAWQRVATAWMEHVNPYTGRSWGEEPALIAVEIINENGLYWDWSHKVPPEMIAWYDRDWNEWLLARYGSRAALAEAWTDASGETGLGPDEDPAAGSVYRPRQIELASWDRPNRSKARGPCRVNDHAAYTHDRMGSFYREATAHLRSLGVKGVIIGSHELRGPDNQHAEITGTGAIAAHLYAGSKLAWGARPGISGVQIEGVDVRSNNWFSNLPRVSVTGVPGINGEWAGGGTAYRADANLQVASTQTFQRVTTSMHFSLLHRWKGQPIPRSDTTYAWRDYAKSIGRTFTSLHDAPWMAINRAAAAVTIRGDVSAPRYRVHIAMSDADRREQNLHALGRSGGGGTIGDAGLFLPLLHRTQIHFFDQAYDGDADVVFTTGRSASGDYRQAKHAVILGDNPWCDPQHRVRDLAAPAKQLYPAIEIAAIEATAFTLNWPWPAAREVDLPALEAAIAVASLPAGATPIGTSADGRWTLGWCDDRHLVLPSAAILHRHGGDPRWLYRLYLAAADRWGMDLGSNAVDRTTYLSDTGEISTDWGTGVQLLDTPLTQAATGFVGLRGENATRNLRVRTVRPFAAIAVTSADGAPIAASRRMLLVATGRVTNTGQVIERGRVTTVGEAPKLIEGLHGAIELVGLEANDLVVYALDHSGRRLGALPVERGAGSIGFELNPAWQTLWFELAGPEVDGPQAGADARAAWPGDPVATPNAPMVDRLAVGDFLDLLRRDGGEDSSGDSEATGRVALTDPAAWKPHQAYANIAVTPAQRDGVPVLDLAVGKRTQDWAGGAWFGFDAPTVDPARCRGIAFHIAGDGTLPRELWVTLSTGKRSWRSRNLKHLVEDPSWREVVLSADDFAPKDGTEGPPAFGELTRIDVSFVGPLMSNAHAVSLGSFQLAVADEAPQDDPGAALPAIDPLDQPQLSIPRGPAPTIDGRLDDAAWAEAVGVAIDEDAVPTWQPLGSHVAEGVHRGEDARCWLLATDDGLALLAAVRQDHEPIATKGDWWLNDCVELFVRTNDSEGKPDSQTFLAYRRARSDAAATNAAGGRIARTRFDGGYALEALLPWTSLGFDAAPSAPFRFDLQIDVADADGRRLLLSLGTGTNEAWISSVGYLTAIVERE